MPLIVDLLDRTVRALKPAGQIERPPTPDDFEPLLYRLEREYTVAHETCVWKSTWIAIFDLAQRLYADQGDLAEFYAFDHASDLVLGRKIDGVDASFPLCLEEHGAIRTFDSIVKDYIRLSKGDCCGATALSHLRDVVMAYSPPDTPLIEIAGRVVKVLRRAGVELGKDDRALRWLAELRYKEQPGKV